MLLFFFLLSECCRQHFSFAKSAHTKIFTIGKCWHSVEMVWKYCSKYQWWTKMTMVNRRLCINEMPSNQHPPSVAVLRFPKTVDSFSDLKDSSPHFVAISPNIESIISASCWHFSCICVRDAHRKREYTRSQFLFRISICACSFSMKSICIYLNGDLIPIGSIHKTQNVCMYTRNVGERKWGKKFIQNEQKKSDSYTPNHIFFPDQYNFFSAFFDTIQKKEGKNSWLAKEEVVLKLVLRDSNICFSRSGSFNVSH